ncbi:MAG: A/G-specific adenine glycosylase [Candidatus Eisenbacteria bacterium]
MASSLVDPARTRYLRARLARWYGERRRDLPWRRTTDPYRIWISEAMLQQTRVAAAIPYYERFVEKLPDAAALARAPVDEVLTLWAGLGYYRRARLLKAAAEKVVRLHGGALPSGEEELMALPGIGRYTAGAIRSIAFGLRAPILDGNVFRVFARFFALTGSWNREADKKRFWEIAETLVPSRNPGDFNQALMELGALICTPSSPGCAACPVRRRCAAHARGEVDRFPEARPKRRPERIEREMYVVTDRRGRVLFLRRPEGGRMAGMWDLPGEPPPAAGPVSKRGSFRHTILHRRYEIDVFAARTEGPARSGPGGRWVAREDLAEFPLTTMANKALRLVPPEGDEL